MQTLEDFRKLVSGLEEQPVQQMYVEACRECQSWMMVNDVLKQYKFCTRRSSQYPEEISAIRLFLLLYFSEDVLNQFEQGVCNALVSSCHNEIN